MTNSSGYRAHGILRVGICAAALGLASSAGAVTVDLSTAPLVSPTSAWNYYAGRTDQFGTLATHTAWNGAWTTRPAELKELARALGGYGRYSPPVYAATVYEYVRNNIATEFRFGLAKGARGAVIDQSGTPFDQAHLMVELLRAGGVSASYKVGTLSLSAAQFQAWTGLADPATGVVNAATACQFLADGGIPASVNGASTCSGLTGALSGTGTPIVMGHIWVVTTTGPSNGEVIFDPSYKINVIKTGIDLAVAMQCGSDSSPSCGSSVLGLIPSATTTAGVVPTITDTNGTAIINVRNQLAAYAVNLQHYIQGQNSANAGTPANNPNMQIEDLLGGRVVDTSQAIPPVASVLFSELPQIAYSAPQYVWGTDIPDAFRTHATIAIDNFANPGAAAGTGVTVFADEVYGSRLRIWGYPSNFTTSTESRELALHLDGKLLARSSVSGAPNLVTLTIAVNHPYSALSGTYANGTLAFPFNIGFSAAVTPVINVVLGWGEASDSTVAHFTALQERDTVTGESWVNPADPNHLTANVTFGGIPGCLFQNAAAASASPNIDVGCYEPQAATLSAMWLAQTSRARMLAGQINHVSVQHHHSVGIAISSQHQATLHSVTILDFHSADSADSVRGSSTDSQAAFQAVAATADRIEGSVLEQSGGIWLGMGGATVSTLSLAGLHGSPILQIDATNVGVGAGQLSSYAASDITDIQQRAASGTILVAQSGGASLLCLPGSVLGHPTQTQIYCYYPLAGYSYSSSAGTSSAYLNSGFGGAGAGADGEDPAQRVLELTKLGDYSLKGRHRAQVDLSDGNLVLTPAADLVTGAGGFPSSLGFQRIYDPPAAFQCYASAQLGAAQCLSASPDMAGLGAGWTHSLAVTAELASDAPAALGRDSALAASSVVAALYVHRQLTLASRDIRTRVAATYTSDWIGTQMWNNSVAVDRPPRRSLFTRLADQVSFDAGQDQGEKLTQSGSLTLDNLFGIPGVNTAGLTFSLSDKSGSTLAFKYGSVNGWFYRALFVADTWTFPTGVTLSFTYTGTSDTNFNYLCPTGVSNNLGRSLTFTGPCVTNSPFTLASVVDDSGRNVSFQTTPSIAFSGTNPNPCPSAITVTGSDSSTFKYSYNPAPSTNVLNRSYCRLAAWFTPTDLSNPYQSLGYDSLFRVSSLTDNSASRNVTNFYETGLYETENQKRGEQVQPTDAAATQFAVTTNYFDRWKRNIQLIDPNGAATSYVYDTQHRLSRTILPEKSELRYLYDARGNLLSTTQHAKPGSGLPDLTSSTSYNEPPGNATCIATPAAICNQPATTTDPSQNVTTYSYFTSASGPTGQVQRIVGPTVTASTVGTSGNPQLDYCYTLTPGVSGFASLLTGKILKVTASLDRVSAYSYNTPGLHLALLTATDDPSQTLIPPASAGGSCTTSAKTGALNNVETFAFDGAGNVSSVLDPRQNTTGYAFDLMRRLTTVSAPAGVTTRYCYNQDGLLVSTNRRRGTNVSDPNLNNETSDGLCPTALDPNAWEIEARAYFPTGDLQSVTDASGNSTVHAYDPIGREQVVQDGEGRQTATVYDPAGQILATWRGGAGWIAGTGLPSTSAPTVNTSWTPSSYSSTSPFRFAAYAYTLNGKRQSVTDANGNVTQSAYDGQDRVAFTLFPDPDSGAACGLALPLVAGAVPSCAGRQTYEQYQYDNNSNRTGLRTRKGDLVTSTYYPTNLVSTKVVPGLSPVNYGYYLSGDMQAVTQGAHSTNYDYDGGGRKWHEQNDGRVVTFGYDPNGNRQSILWPDSYQINYLADELNRMSVVTEQSSGAIQAIYAYDVLSRRRGLSFNHPQTSAIDYGYTEPNDNLNVLTNTWNNAAPQFVYTYNHALQLKTFTTTDDFFLPPTPAPPGPGYGVNKLNQYTANGPITGTAADGTPTIAGSHGRFIPIALDDISFVVPLVGVGASPRDNGADPGGNTIVYDLNGNLRRWTGPDGARNTYTYDAENRLRTAVTGSRNASYDYDPLGRRISKTVDGVSTGYLLDGDDEIAEYNLTNGVWPATAARRYISGAKIDERIAVVDGSTNAKSYYHVNRQGSVLATTDGSGNLVQRLAYDEYGNLASGSTPTGQVYRYAGRRFDEETGLYYYRARYYAPQLGRFLQTDPKGYGDDLNLYTYTYNDPLNKSDPSGKCLEDLCIGEAFAFCAVAPGVCVTIAAAVGIVIHPPGRSSDVPSLPINEEARRKKGDRPHNLDDPDETQDSIGQRQAKQRQTRPGLQDVGGDWEGDKKRPKSSAIDSTTKTDDEADFRRNRNWRDYQRDARNQDQEDPQQDKPPQQDPNSGLDLIPSELQNPPIPGSGSEGSGGF